MISRDFARIVAFFLCVGAILVFFGVAWTSGPAYWIQANLAAAGLSFVVFALIFAVEEGLDFP
jgi:hypothetical protein